MIKLAIDAMGGDFAPKEMVEGVNLAIKNIKDIELFLYGKSEEIKQYLVPNVRVRVIEANDKLDMGVKDPISIIRRNPELSMVKAFKAVADKECQGAVTAGPTQGAVVAGHLVIRRLKGMKRVALCPQLPPVGGKSRLLLDCGANTDIRPEHIVQHAEFASVFFRETRGVEKPLVGLINIGSEPGKGRELEKDVFALLEKNENINFFGNVETKEVLSTKCDILVTDGFSGNVIMKAIEGTAKVMGDVLKSEIKSSLGGKIGYFFMKKNLKRYRNAFNADDVGGSLVFGIDGIVVKAHGSSNAYAFSKAIELAAKAVRGNVIETMKKYLMDSPDE